MSKLEKQNNKIPPVPDWIGNTPFPPEKKRPCKITENMYVAFLYGFIGTQVENHVFASTDKVTMAEWILPPGSHYEPAEFHLHGDECYYLVEGEATAFNAETGETFIFREGEAMLIPQRTRHQIYNMTNRRIVTISCFAPKVWADDGMGTIIPQVEHPRFYKGPEDPACKEAPLLEYVSPSTKRSIDSLVNWPDPGPKLRETKQLTIIKPQDQLTLIHEKEKHVLFSFVVSNDYFHLAVLKVPVAGISELESHEGDEVINVLEGELCVRISSAENERMGSVTYPHTWLKTREPMLIPEGVKPQYLNFTDLLPFSCSDQRYL